VLTMENKKAKTPQKRKQKSQFPPKTFFKTIPLYF